MKLSHRVVKRQVADKAIGWQSPVSPVNNRCFLCSGTKQLYRGCCSDHWNWLCGNFCYIANSALLHAWGAQSTSLCDGGEWEETTCYSWKSPYPQLFFSTGAPGWQKPSPQPSQCTMDSFSCLYWQTSAWQLSWTLEFSHEVTEMGLLQGLGGHWKSKPKEVPAIQTHKLLSNLVDCIYLFIYYTRLSVEVGWQWNAGYPPAPFWAPGCQLSLHLLRLALEGTGFCRMVLLEQLSWVMWFWLLSPVSRWHIGFKSLSSQ